MIKFNSITYTCYAIPGAPNWWPRKPRGQSRDYALDITAAIDPTTDIITEVSASIAPSGSGELVGANLLVSGDVLILTTSAGQPSRVYTIQFVVTMADGRVYDFFVYQGIPPGLPGYIIPPAPTPGFGTAVTWSRVAPPPQLFIPLLWGF